MKEGRYVMCELENLDEPDKRLSICNIYAPNKDRPDFFVEVINKSIQPAAETIIVGDFNLVQNIEIDRKGQSDLQKQLIVTLNP